MANSSSHSPFAPRWEVQTQFVQSPYYGYRDLYDQAGLSYTNESGAGPSRPESEGTVSSPVGNVYPKEEQCIPATAGESKTKRRAPKHRQEIDKAAHLLKRRGQNRASQRAFRERKERYTKELEIKVSELVDMLESANLENSAAQSQIAQMENELSYYRHLLFASQTRAEALISTTDISDNPSFLSNRKYTCSGAPRSEADSNSHVIASMDSDHSSPDHPSNSTALVKEECTPSSISACSTPVDTFGYSYSPTQSSSVNLGSHTSMPLTMMESQTSTFAANSEDATWEMNTSKWTKGDSFSVDLQAVTYLQSTQSSTVWAGSWD